MVLGIIVLAILGSLLIYAFWQGYKDCKQKKEIIANIRKRKHSYKIKR